MPNNKASMEFFGDVELVKRLEAITDKVPQAIATAMKESAKIPAAEMLAFVRRHHYSGLTERSFVETEPVVRKSKNGAQVVMELGFSVKKGGIAAIFLNLGGLHNPPYFFIKKAVDGNADAIAKAQNDAIGKAIREFG